MRLRRRRAPADPAQVHRITDARRPHADDQHDRFVKYTVSMSIRMVCIVLALVVRGPLQWVFIAGAVVLPYVAVVIANASREQAPSPPEAWGVDRSALGSGSAGTAATGQPPDGPPPPSRI